MSLALAVACGYLIGATPTANAIAGMAGIDLRTSGSGNPGANNAFRVGGYRLAVAVLATEILKGALAAILGGALAAEPGMAAAGVAAVAGNVFNVWYRLAGGKGLGVTLGVLIAAWPLAAVPSLLVIALLAWATRSTGLAAIGTLGLLIASAFFSKDLNLIGGWGVESPGLLSGMSIGFGAVMAPKHIRDVLSRSPSRH